MLYVTLTGDTPPVSRLCLGTAQFGARIPQDDAVNQLDHFFEHGGNFIDTAHVYGDWLPGKKAVSEHLIGAWLKEKKNRGKAIIATKGGHPLLSSMEKSRLSEKELRTDLEGSLSALGLDCIDWYFLHRDDMSIPVVDILSYLEKFRSEGKIRRYGCSNWKLERIVEADSAARDNGFACNQLHWGIGDINAPGITDPTAVTMDKKTFEYHTKTQKPVMAYKAACNGYFSKRLAGKSAAPALEALYGGASNDFLLKIFPMLENETGLPAAALSLAYIMAQDFPAVPIASFSSIAQLDEGLSACDFTFPRNRFEEIRESRVYLYQ